MLTARLRLIALPPVAVAAAVACGSSGGSGQAGSCAPAPPAGYLAAARIAFAGIMLPGPAVRSSHGSVLVSPARVRVTRYLKGGGPAVVTVTTGVTRTASGAASNAEGIEPRAGQRWTIYTASRQMPYETSDCNGTALAGGRYGQA
jgi:hypothetical protein